MAIHCGYACLPVTVADRLGLFAKQGAAAGVPGLTVRIQKISGADRGPSRGRARRRRTARESMRDIETALY